MDEKIVRFSPDWIVRELQLRISETQILVEQWPDDEGYQELLLGYVQYLASVAPEPAYRQ